MYICTLQFQALLWATLGLATYPIRWGFDINPTPLLYNGAKPILKNLFYFHAPVVSQHISLNFILKKNKKKSCKREVKKKLHTLQMFYMLFLLSYVCQPNSQTTLSNFNSLKPVIKKRQFNAIFTIFQNGFLHAFVCDWWKWFSVISVAYIKQIPKEIFLFFTDECM